ncbi:hypothetical protein PM082_024365 [Marasmius tenuissimus]|nr:hypothetical protein PM082_024365 [Marasmius tenuissimus]
MECSCSLEMLEKRLSLGLRPFVQSFIHKFLVHYCVSTSTMNGSMLGEHSRMYVRCSSINSGEGKEVPRATPSKADQLPAMWSREVLQGLHYWASYYSYAQHAVGVGSCFGKITPAIGTHGVTLNSPPRSELFAMFHRAPAGGTNHWASTTVATPNASTSDTLLTLLVGHLFNNSNRPVNTPLPDSRQPKVQTPQTPSKRKGREDTLLSSSPRSPSLYNPYPTVKLFFELLGNTEPPRAGALSNLAKVLADKDMYHIDEIAKVGEEVYVTKYGLTEGNARFVAKRVATEVKHVKKSLNSEEAYS